MSDISQSNIAIRTVTAVVAVTALSATAYGLYFDFKRRNDAKFRKLLKRRTKKQLRKHSSQVGKLRTLKLQTVGDFLNKELLDDPIPNDSSMREATFTFNIENAERLSLNSGNEMESAVRFYKALCVYPNPAELLGIYQKSIPEPIYEMVVMMIAVKPPSNVAAFLSDTQSMPFPRHTNVSPMSKIDEIDE